MHSQSVKRSHRICQNEGIPSGMAMVDVRGASSSKSWWLTDATTRKDITTENVQDRDARLARLHRKEESTEPRVKTPVESYKRTFGGGLRNVQATSSPLCLAK